MYEIYLDTTDRHKNLVKLLKDGKEIDALEGEVAKEGGDLVVLISKIVEKNSLKLSEISDFKMNEGPGSFTGLRIGASVVNALRWSLLHKDPSDLVLPKYQASTFDRY